jgi:hypothetical protein
MAKIAMEGLERRIDRVFFLSEKIILRTLIFACFVLEVYRFVSWLVR